MYFWMILFSYFFLFLNSFHVFYGFTQYSRTERMMEMPAPRELAMGLTIHSAVSSL